MHQVTIFYSSPFLDLEYHDKYGYLYANWKGIQNEITVKTGGVQMLGLLQQHRYERVLNDNRYVVSAWQGATQWTATEWFPQMFAAGMKRFAWINSPTLFAQLSIKQTLKGLADTDLVRAFNNIEEARQWLLSDEP